MDETVCAELKEVVDNIIDGVITRDTDRLSDWSNRTIHNACIFREEKAIYVAIISYALSKIIDKRKLWDTKAFNNFLDNVLKDLKKLKESIEEKDDKTFSKMLKSILLRIHKFDEKFSSYAQRVIDFSKIQKGVKMYSHGISLSTVAEFLGINKWDLMRKIGELKREDELPHLKLDAKSRLKTARKVLGD